MANLKKVIDLIANNTHEANKLINIPAQGRIISKKQFKKVMFYNITDGANTIQITDTNGLLKYKNLKVDEVIKLNNYIVPSREDNKVKNEIYVNENSILEVTGPIDTEDYVFQSKQKKTLSYLRNFPQYKFQTAYLSNLLKFRSFVEMKILNHMVEEGFVKVAPPLITENDCENAGETFSVISTVKKHFFKPTKTQKENKVGGQSNLTVSTQLHLEVLNRSIQKVFTMTPCFRAEKSDTNRHLSEFWMLEAELSYVDKVEEVCDVTEKMIRSVISDLLKDNRGLSFISTYEPFEDTYDHIEQGDEAQVTRPQRLLKRWMQLDQSEWVRLDYSEAIELIQKQIQEKDGFFINESITWGDEICTEHEKWLATEHFKSPVFVLNYPKKCKPFYMKKQKDKEMRDTVANFDLLFPEIGEIVGGSLREDSYKLLTGEMQERNMNMAHMKWYTDLRLNGSVPHGGFGLGFERLIVHLYGLKNIKDAIPFYRSYNNTLKV
ncbi:Asparagine--tRNA ligase, mitochondrial [Hanseniaspora uvarum DSM 2768]|nr:Asparagine--tRNA ligase, mitochondrial [Hanseniaspora uvarum DSM 2768]